MIRRTTLLRLLGTAAIFVSVSSLAGCPAVYPELPTRMRKALTEAALDPPPPENVYWLKFASARVPERTRGGKTWGESLGKLPDPIAKLYINDVLVMKTPPQSNTLEPTWPNGPRGNFKISPEDKLRIELWDSNTINDKPIIVRDVGHIDSDARLNQRIRFDYDVGGEVVLTVERAHAMLGLGLWYELRTESAFITRLMEGSPASRAGLAAGDEILKIGNGDVHTMSADVIQSAFNAVPSDGISLMVKHADGTTLSVTVKEGAIYPTYEQQPDLD